MFTPYPYLFRSRQITGRQDETRALIIKNKPELTVKQRNDLLWSSNALLPPLLFVGLLFFLAMFVVFEVQKLDGKPKNHNNDNPIPPIPPVPPNYLSEAFFQLLNTTQPQIAWLLGNSTANEYGSNPNFVPIMNTAISPSPSILFQQTPSSQTLMEGMYFPGLQGNNLATTVPFVGTISPPFTIGVMFLTTSTNGGQLFGSGDLQTMNSYYYPFEIYLDANGHVNTYIYVQGAYQSNGNRITSTIQPPISVNVYNDGLWHSAIFTITTAYMTLFLDNKEALTIKSGSGTAYVGFDQTSVFTSAFYLRVAGDNLHNIDTTDASYYLQGYLANLFILNNIVTNTQANTVYSSIFSNTAYLIIEALTPYLYWPLNQASSSNHQIVDQTANNVNGVYFTGLVDPYEVIENQINNQVLNSLMFPGEGIGGYLTPDSSFYADVTLSQGFTIGIWFTVVNYKSNLFGLELTTGDTYTLGSNEQTGLLSMSYYLSGSNTHGEIPTNLVLTGKQNYLVFVTVSPSKACVYTDPVLVSCGAGNFILDDTTVMVQNIWIGSLNVTFSFTGSMGPFLFYDHTLNSSTVALFYSTLNASASISNAISNEVVQFITWSPPPLLAVDSSSMPLPVVQISYSPWDNAVMDFSATEYSVQWTGFQVIESIHDDLDQPPQTYFENFILTRYMLENVWAFLPMNDPISTVGNGLRDISNHNHIGHFYPNGYMHATGQPELLPGFTASVYLGGGSPNPNVINSAYTSGQFANVNTFSIEVYFSTTTTAGGGLISGTATTNGYITDSSPYSNYIWMTTAGKIQGGIPGHYAITTRSYNDGQPHQVVFVSQTNTSPYVSIYVDGGLVASLIVSGQYGVLQNSVVLGYADGNFQPSGYGLQVSVSDLIVYGIALQPADVLANYEAAINPLNVGYTIYNVTETCRTMSRGAVICNDTSVQGIPSLDNSWSVSLWVTMTTSMYDDDNGNNSTTWVLIEDLISVSPWTFIPSDLILQPIPNTYVNGWSHLVLTYNIATMLVYWNGSPVYSWVIGSDVSLPSDLVMNLDGNPYGLMLDNVTIYADALTSGQISQIYMYSMGIQNYQVLYLEAVADDDDDDSSNIEFQNAVPGNLYPYVQFFNNSYAYSSFPSANCRTIVYQNSNMTFYYSNLIPASYSFGQQNIQLDLPGCTSYSLTAWVWIPAMSTRFLDTVYLNIIDDLGNLFPLHISFYGNSFQYYANYGYAIESGKWTHLTITYEDDWNEFFVDGNLVFSYLAYTVPPPKPYLSGTFHFTPSNVVFSNIGLYCNVLTPEQMVMDMTQLADPDTKIPAYPAAELDPVWLSSLAMPNYTFPVPLSQTDYIAGFLGVFVTPEQVAAVQSTLPDNLFTHFYIDQINGNDANDGHTLATAWATPNPINTINLANTLPCIDIEFCYGDRFYNQGTIQLPTISSLTCPLVVKPILCPGRPTENGNNQLVGQPLYPLISGLSILPQITGVIGWTQVDTFITHGGLNLAAHETVLAYNLSLLYKLQQASEQTFLTYNPMVFNGSVFSYQPIVLNKMYVTAGMPELQDPLYPYGKRLDEAFPSSYVSGLANGGGTGSLSCNSTIQPGAWCLEVYGKMFKFNQTAYDRYFVYSTGGNMLANHSISLGLMFDYSAFVPSFTTTNYYLSQGMQMNESHYFNCSQWYLSDVLSTGITWDDPGIIGLGVSYENTLKYGYQLPGAWAGGTITDFDSNHLWYPGYAYYGSWNGNDGTQNNACPGMRITYATTTGSNVGPPFGSPIPNATFTGPVITGAPSYILRDCDTCFDNPGEYIYLNGILYLIPWTDADATSLLTTTDQVTFNTVDVAQSLYITQGWATVHNYNITVGLQNNAINSAVQVQELEISGYSQWGINMGGTGNLVLLNITVHQCVQSVNLNTGIGYTHYIVNTSAINQTLFRPGRVWNGENNGLSSGVCFFCGAQSTILPAQSGMCVLLNSTCYYSDNTNQWDFARGLRMISSWSNAAWERNGYLWGMEHSLVNLSNSVWADAGADINDRAGNPWWFNWNTVDGNAQAWRNGIPYSKFNNYGSTKGNAAEVDYWLDAYSFMLHGNLFYNMYLGIEGHNDGGLAMGSSCCNSWNQDNYDEYSTNLCTSGTESWFAQGPIAYNLGILCNGTQSQQRPAQPITGYARPMIIANNLNMWDDFLVNSNSMPHYFPYYWPTPQGTSALWLWYEPNAFTGYIANNTFAFANVRYHDPLTGATTFDANTFNSSYLSIEDGFPAYFDGYPNTVQGYTMIDNMIAYAIADIENILASSANNPPVTGRRASLDTKARWEEEIKNEQNVHLKYTEPAWWAVIQTATGYYFPPQGVSFATFEPSDIAHFDGSTPKVWPNVSMTSWSNNVCTSYTDCAYSLQLNMTIDPVTGVTNDLIYGQSYLTQCNNASFSSGPASTTGNNHNPASGIGYNWNGNSWDNLMGLVWDATGGSSPDCLLNNWPAILHSYTASWWVWNPMFQQAGTNLVYDCNYAYRAIIGDLGYGGWNIRTSYMENPMFGGCLPIPMYQSTTAFPAQTQDCMTWYSVNTDTSASCGAGYNPYAGVGQDSGQNTLGFPCQHGCGSYGTSYNTSILFGYWVQFAMATSYYNNSVSFYINGQYQWTVPGLPVNIIGGSYAVFGLLNRVRRYSKFKIYAGTLNPAQIASNYAAESTIAGFNGPHGYTSIATINGISGPLSLYWSLTYNSTSNTFWNGNTGSPSIVAAMGVTQSTNSLVNLYALDPIGSGSIVITNATTNSYSVSGTPYFVQNPVLISINTPILSNWNLTFRQYFTSLPTTTPFTTYWFGLPIVGIAQNRSLSLMFYWTSPNNQQLCVASSVYQPISPTGSGAYYKQSACFTALIAPLALNQWYTFSLIGMDSTHTLTFYVNGALIGTITTITRSLQLTNTLMFYPPEYMWNYPFIGSGRLPKMCAEFTQSSCYNAFYSCYYFMQNLQISGF